jgi:uncharacterized protein (DUF4213/DUF364 family)
MCSNKLWKLYDVLIGGIPEELSVDEMICGAYHALVRCGDGYGLSVVLSDDTQPPTIMNKTPGMALRELAAGVKSWNFVEASIGQAAINAYYNAPEVARKNGVNVSNSRFVEDRIYDPFIGYQNVIRNKKVAVVGHFPYLEQLFQPVCDLSILERLPEEGDYPYTAAEYLLPNCDYAFISCSTLIDKSLPRFLEIAKQATVIIVGPSTPLAPALFQFGVHDLSGFVIKDGEKARRICLGQENYRIYSTGQKVNLKVADSRLPPHTLIQCAGFDKILWQPRENLFKKRRFKPHGFS